MYNNYRYLNLLPDTDPKFIDWIPVQAIANDDVISGICAISFGICGKPGYPSQGLTYTQTWEMSKMRNADPFFELHALIEHLNMRIREGANFGIRYHTAEEALEELLANYSEDKHNDWFYYHKLLPEIQRMI